MALAFASNTLIEAASMSSSFQSEDINLHRKNGFAIHAIFTGTPNGSLYLSASIDGSNWIVIPDSPQAITTAGDVLFNVANSNYLWVRLHYTRSSSTGSLDAVFSVKEVA